MAQGSPFHHSGTSELQTQIGVFQEDTLFFSQQRTASTFCARRACPSIALGEVTTDPNKNPMFAANVCRN